MSSRKRIARRRTWRGIRFSRRPRLLSEILAWPRRAQAVRYRICSETVSRETFPFVGRSVAGDCFADCSGWNGLLERRRNYRVDRGSSYCIWFYRLSPAHSLEDGVTGEMQKKKRV